MQRITKNFEQIDFPLPSKDDIKDAELLKSMSDNDIDLSDIPDLSNMTARPLYQRLDKVAV